MRNGSGFRRLFYILLFLFLLVLGGLLFLTFQPQDLSDIAGQDGKASTTNVSARIKEAATTRESITLSEAEINSWLARTLTARQKGRSAEHVEVSVTGVRVRLSENNGGRAEVVIERQVEGRPHTISMYFRIEHEKKGDQWTAYIHKDGGLLMGVVPLGGRFGRAKVPQGFLLIVKSAFEKLGAVYSQELSWLRDDITQRGGGKIRIEENQLRIDFPPPEKEPSILAIP